MIVVHAVVDAGVNDGIAKGTGQRMGAITQSSGRRKHTKELRDTTTRRWTRRECSECGFVDTCPGKSFGGFNVETGGFKQAELSRNNEPEHAETTRGLGSIGKHEHLRLTGPRWC